MTYPFIKATHYRTGGNAAPTRVVIHRTESPLRAGSARAVARYFQTTAKNASAHLVADMAEVVCCVHDGDTAYHAPPNAHSLGIELCGYSADDDWATDNSEAMLGLASQAVALWCREYDIPVVWLSSADLKAGARGICSHAAVAQAFHQSTHTDPGPFFPHDRFLTYVRTHLQPTPPPAPSPVVICRGRLGGKPVALKKVTTPNLDDVGDGSIPVPIDFLAGPFQHAPHDKYAPGSADKDNLVAPAGLHQADTLRFVVAGFKPGAGYPVDIFYLAAD